jgi:hypothetical protein
VGKSILDVGTHECKWPVAEDKLGRHLFCGKPTVHYKLSWCIEHLRGMYSKRVPIEVAKILRERGMAI